MASDILKGMWKQVRGEAKKQWGKLTDDDLDVVEGESEKLIGRLQERYGYTRQQAESEVSSFLEKHGGRSRSVFDR